MVRFAKSSVRLLALIALAVFISVGFVALAAIWPVLAAAVFGAAIVGGGVAYQTRTKPEEVTPTVEPVATVAPVPTAAAPAPAPARKRSPRKPTVVKPASVPTAPAAPAPAADTKTKPDINILAAMQDKDEMSEEDHERMEYLNGGQDSEDDVDAPPPPKPQRPQARPTARAPKPTPPAPKRPQPPRTQQQPPARGGTASFLALEDDDTPADRLQANGHN